MKNKIKVVNNTMSMNRLNNLFISDIIEGDITKKIYLKSSKHGSVYIIVIDYNKYNLFPFPFPCDIIVKYVLSIDNGIIKRIELQQWYKEEKIQIITNPKIKEF